MTPSATERLAGMFFIVLYLLFFIGRKNDIFVPTE
jgi:hypothetical protein